MKLNLPRVFVSASLLFLPCYASQRGHRTLKAKNSKKHSSSLKSGAKSQKSSKSVDDDSVAVEDECVMTQSMENAQRLLAENERDADGFRDKYTPEQLSQGMAPVVDQVTEKIKSKGLQVAITHEHILDLNTPKPKIVSAARLGPKAMISENCTVALLDLAAQSIVFVVGLVFDVPNKLGNVIAENVLSGSPGTIDDIYDFVTAKDPNGHPKYSDARIAIHVVVSFVSAIGLSLLVDTLMKNSSWEQKALDFVSIVGNIAAMIITDFLAEMVKIVEVVSTSVSFLDAIYNVTIDCDPALVTPPTNGGCAGSKCGTVVNCGCDPVCIEAGCGVCKSGCYFNNATDNNCLDGCGCSSVCLQAGADSCPQNCAA